MYDIRDHPSMNIIGPFKDGGRLVSLKAKFSFEVRVITRAYGRSRKYNIFDFD